MTAFRQLIPRLVAIAVLAILYLGLALAVALGWLNGPDRTVAQTLATYWNPHLHLLFQGIAELGGIELTTLLMVGFAIVVVRRGFPADALAVLTFVAAQAFEVFYKAQLYHPEPPRTLAHDDGPSITNFLPSVSTVHNSFPSGHVVRAVIAYGLIAFALRRLAPWPWARALALPAAVVIIVLVAFDRLYLEVHWESDVIGGIVLGSIALVAATVWLDRPRRADN